MHVQYALDARLLSCHDSNQLSWFQPLWARTGTQVRQCCGNAKLHGELPPWVTCISAQHAFGVSVNSPRNRNHSHVHKQPQPHLGWYRSTLVQPLLLMNHSKESPMCLLCMPCHTGPFPRAPVPHGRIHEPGRTWTPHHRAAVLQVGLPAWQYACSAGGAAPLWVAVCLQQRGERQPGDTGLGD
jgi:hypothetical protein